MEKSTIESDKVIFAVSFLTLLVTLSSYKDAISQIKIIFFSYSFSLYDLLMYISLILFCSVYISAIDKLRDSNLGLKKFKILDKCCLIADYLYLIALIGLPVIFLSCYILSSITYEFIYLLTIPWINTLVGGVVLALESPGLLKIMEHEKVYYYKPVDPIITTMYIMYILIFLCILIGIFVILVKKSHK